MTEKNTTLSQRPIKSQINSLKPAELTSEAVSKPKKLLDQVSEALHTKHYDHHLLSPSTLQKFQSILHRTCLSTLERRISKFGDLSALCDLNVIGGWAFERVSEKSIRRLQRRFIH